jgi:NitT/TauT family transport system substrate-binding protein
MDDKMVAMTRYSATAMLADHLVDSAKLASERVFRIQVNDVLVRLGMMETGTMDAMLLPEPQATTARFMGCNVLYDSYVDSLRMGVLAFSEKALEDTLRRAQLQTFIRAYDEACDSLNILGLGHYADVIAQECHVEKALVDSMDIVKFNHVQSPRQTDIDRAKAWLKK